MKEMVSKGLNSLFFHYIKKKKRSKSYYICTFFCLCKRKCQRKAHRQWSTAIAGRPDLASVLLLTELNNSYHLHINNPKKETLASWFIANSKGARPPLEFYTPINEEFTSAFFFVFHKTSSALEIANGKDSAFRCYKKHAATPASYHLKK